MSKHDEYIQKIADRLVEQIKNNEAPWQKPWEAGRSYDFVPVNSEGKPYRGANLINLSSQATARGYTDNRWYTFAGAKKLGAKVRKGEKGTPIHYWKFHEDKIKKDENGKTVYDDKGKPVKVRVELEHPRVFYAHVFNAEQIDGIPEKEYTAPVMEEWERHQRCESIVENYDVEVIHKPQDRAYYHPYLDHVVMPERSQFKSADLYYATLLHELGHSTGHESRLNRDMSGGFGSEQYAKEELRAEIASMMLGQELQIGHDPSQHIAYLESWAKAVKEDPKEIFKAVKDADKITQHLLSFDKERDRSAESDIAKEAEATKEDLGADYDDFALVAELSKHDRAVDTYNTLADYAQAEGNYVMKLNPTDSDNTYEAKYYDEGQYTGISTEIRLEHGFARTRFNNEFISEDWSIEPSVQKEWLGRAFELRNNPDRSAEGDITKEARFAVSDFDHTAYTPYEEQLVNGVLIEDKETGEHYALMNIVDSTGYDPNRPLEDYPDGSIYSVAEYYPSKDAWQSRSQDTLVEQSHAVLNKLGANPNSKDAELKEFARQFAHNGSSDAGKAVDVVSNLSKEKVQSLINREGIDLNPDAQKIVASLKEAEFSQKTIARIEAQSLDTTSQLNHTFGSDLALEDKIAVYADEIKRYAGNDADKADFAISKLEASFGHNLDNKIEAEIEAQTPQMGLPPNQEQNQVQEQQTEATIATQNTYLYVPFEEKDEAKALGAKWDKENKLWYAPQGTDLDKFSKWRDAPAPQASIGTSLSPEDEFAQYLESQGVVVKAGHPKLDGKWHRLPMAGDKKGNLNASYVVHTDNGIPRGYFKDFHSGFEEKWVSEQRTGDRVRASSFDLEKVRAEAEARQQAEYDEAGDIASKLYAVAEPANASHKYLGNKSVTPEGGLMAVPSNDKLPEELKSKLVIGNDWREAMALRKDPNEERIVMTKGDILLPVQNKDGDIRTVQTIAENGFKGFLKGGEKAGNYTTIGEIEPDKPFMIVEGWATGKTINEQTKIPVVVAFDKGNLTAVAKTMREEHPNSRIYFGADNDHQQEAKYKAEGRTGVGGELNGGIEKANEASERIGGHVLIPQFEPTDKGSDWNDIFVDKGAEVFKQQMREQVLRHRQAEEVKKQSTPSIRQFAFNDPELAKVQDSTVTRATQDAQGLIEDYKAMDNTFNGRYVSSDMFKEVFTDYNQSPQNRSKFNEAVKGASEHLASELFKQTLQNQPAEGKDTVVLLTGATGSGKTSTILNDGELEANVALVYENELSDQYEKQDTLAKVEQALNAGYKVDVVAVHPKAEQALENTWKRFKDLNDGRGATIDSIAKAQANTHDSLKAIGDRFGDKVNLTVVDKTGGNADLKKQVGWDKLGILKSEGNEKQILDKLEKHLAQEYKKGSIDYETLRQSAGTDEKAKQISSRLDRQTGISSNPNERGRELQTAGDSKSNELGKTHTSEVGRSDKAVTFTSLRNRLKNNKTLDSKTKQNLDTIISAVEQMYDGQPDLQQDKLKEINGRMNELEQMQQLETVKPAQSKDTGMSR